MSEVLAKAQHFGDTLDSIVRPPSLEIGKLLCSADAKPNAQNPNVEVLCMALQTTPLTKDKFMIFFLYLVCGSFVANCTSSQAF